MLDNKKTKSYYRLKLLEKGIQKWEADLYITLKDVYSQRIKPIPKVNIDEEACLKALVQMPRTKE